MKRIIPMILAALLLIAAIGCSSAVANFYNTSSLGNGTTSETTETNDQPNNDDAPKPNGEDTNPPKEDITVGQYPIATITMKDGGVMKLELYPDVAPNTVKNFISLANSGFYDGKIFHRIIANFMIQGGDPTGTGMGGPGYSIKGEFSSNGVKNDLKHVRGVISMARAYDPDSAGSQFFIMHADAPHLDGQYAAFGKLVEGFTVLDRIAMVKTDRNDKPITDVVIATIRVETFGVDYGAPDKIQ